MHTLVGFFFAMKYQKPPLSINSQVVKLQAKGLIFSSTALAKKFLKNVNYYRLSCYFIPFYKKKSKKFLKNTSFDQIKNLYILDNKLRGILFNSIQQIEVAIRSRVINKYSNKYGAHWYLNSKLFKEFKDYSSFQGKAFKVVSDNQKKEKFINHYMSKYDDPPTPANWMIIELLTIGQLSQLYKSLRDDKTKKDIAKDFGVTELVLESWLHNVNYIRNICAHHIRLWNRDLRISPKNPRRISFQFLNSTHGFRHDKIYFSISIMIYLLRRISSGNDETSSIITFADSLTVEERESMGFPDNYKNEPLWN